LSLRVLLRCLGNRLILDPLEHPQLSWLLSHLSLRLDRTPDLRRRRDRLVDLESPAKLLVRLLLLVELLLPCSSCVLTLVLLVDQLLLDDVVSKGG
jgi:hypothetical protein